ncbi:MAG: hypothetical protein ABJI22_14975, partial [Maribacter sp.]
LNFILFNIMNNTENPLQNHDLTLINVAIERSQSQVLAAGYKWVNFKSNIKKKLKIISKKVFFTFKTIL